MTIAVFGATGHLGAHVVDALLARGVEPASIRAIGRNADRLAALAERGLATAVADLDDAASVAAAVDGAERVLLVSGSEVGKRVPQHRNVVEAAKNAGVAQLVYTSAPDARETELVLAPEHKATEELIEAAGVPATILRNGWYTENYRPDFDRARETGVVAKATGDGRVATAPRADYAEAAAVVLTSDGHVGRVYELSGDTAWDFSRFAATAAKVLRKPVVYRALTPEEDRAALVEGGLDGAMADFVVALDGNIAAGLLSATSGELRELLGRPTVPLEETMRDWA